ncbi:MAG TPA: hypothetical protein VFK02_33965 [Kofleriaceae bacterium]|nr:hypothetical protein [Kofleriaceae bacterium]
MAPETPAEAHAVAPRPQNDAPRTDPVGPAGPAGPADPARPARPAPPAPATRTPPPTPPPAPAAPPRGKPAGAAKGPGIGAECGPDDACAPGLACIKYYGFAGPRGPELKSCEIRCEGDAACPSGYTCMTVSDGPGRVCRQ